VAEDFVWLPSKADLSADLESWEVHQGIEVSKYRSWGSLWVRWDWRLGPFQQRSSHHFPLQVIEWTIPFTIFWCWRWGSFLHQKVGFMTPPFKWRFWFGSRLSHFQISNVKDAGELHFCARAV
jgi:hypothetical protein